MDSAGSREFGATTGVSAIRFGSFYLGGWKCCKLIVVMLAHLLEYAQNCHYTLSELILWYVNYILLKLFKKM